MAAGDTGKFDAGILSLWIKQGYHRQVVEVHGGFQLRLLAFSIGLHLDMVVKRCHFL